MRCRRDLGPARGRVGGLRLAAAAAPVAALPAAPDAAGLGQPFAAPAAAPVARAASAVERE